MFLQNCFKDDYKMGNTCRIKIPHFWCLEYYEGDKKMTVDIDFRDPVLYLNTKLITRWDEPFEKETITDEEKKRIIRNIKYELKLLDNCLEIVLEDV